MARETLRTLGDNALETEDEQVRLVDGGYGLLEEDRTGGCHSQAFGERASVHRLPASASFTARPALVAWLPGGT
jgi:hypothetical protein